MTPAVRLEHFKPLDKDGKVDRAAKGQGNPTRIDTTDVESADKPHGLVKKTKSRPLKALGTSTKGTAPNEAVAPSKTTRQRPNPPSDDALSVKFGSALCPRNQDKWNQLCSMTDMKTGQLRRSVGTPDDPLFAYEEAVHQRGMGQDLLLCVGHDIIPTEKGELPKKSERILKKLRKQAIEARLPELLKGILPGGWDAFGQPWALMDCPARKEPRVPSVHESSRVTVAVLVSFPPEPFYFVGTIHMDGVIRVSNKVGHITHKGLPGELNADQTLKEAHKTYGRLKLPGYRDSIPVQECLKEPQWKAYREGHWGK